MPLRSDFGQGAFFMPVLAEQLPSRPGMIAFVSPARVVKWAYQ